jgi:pyruvate formate lyase activating enzyme
MAGMCAIPLIADVKRHSLEDGPGIRSVVFFKECPLRCVFCQNPETQSREVEIAFSERECIHCGTCVKVCSQGAIDLDFPGRIRRKRCTQCGGCAAACPGKGLRVIGRYFSPDALAELLLRDLPFYSHSGGGVTLSGGEATLYPDYLESLLALLKRSQVHIALQTCGVFEYAPFARQVLPHVDVIYYDIKIADANAHRRHTGRDNRRILDNFARLVREDRIPVHARVPLVPGITDGWENLAAIVEFLRMAGAQDMVLLPYNPLGTVMAACLGRPRPPIPATFMNPEKEKAVYDGFEKLLAEKGRGRQAV